MTTPPQRQSHTILLPSTEILDKHTVQPYRQRLTHGYIATNTLTVAGHALSKCPRLQTLFIPEQVRYIGVWALRSCLSLKQVICLAHPDSLGDKVFARCKKLRFLLLSDSLYQDTNPAYWHKHGVHKKALIVARSRLYEWRNKQPLTLKNYDITQLAVLYRLALDKYYKPSWTELAKDYPMLLLQDVLLCIHPNKRLKCLPITQLKNPTPPLLLDAHPKKRSRADFEEQQATLLRNCGLFGNSHLDKIIQVDHMAEFMTTQLTAKWLCAKTHTNQEPDKENLVNR